MLELSRRKCSNKQTWSWSTNRKRQKRIKISSPDFKPSDHYFKIDRRIVEINGKALSEKALKAYIICCRRVNPGKNSGCSFPGAKDMSNLAGIPKNLFDKTIQELVNKNLIALRPDVKAGYFKSIPIEVLSFPNYDKKNRKFTIQKKIEHQHRIYRDGDYFNIPSSFLENGSLRFFNSSEMILSILKLFEKTDWEEFGGVDFRLVHSYNKGNLKGYKSFISDKSYSIVEEDDVWFYNDKLFKGSDLNLIHHSKLFFSLPALLYEDPNDPSYSYIKKIITKQTEEGEYIFLTPNPIGHRVIWILRPQIMVIDGKVSTTST